MRCPGKETSFAELPGRRECRWKHVRDPMTGWTGLELVQAACRSVLSVARRSFVSFLERRAMEKVEKGCFLELGWNQKQRNEQTMDGSSASRKCTREKNT